MIIYQLDEHDSSVYILLQIVEVVLLHFLPPVLKTPTTDRQLATLTSVQRYANMYRHAKYAPSAICNLKAHCNCYGKSYMVGDGAKFDQHKAT